MLFNGDFSGFHISNFSGSKSAVASQRWSEETPEVDFKLIAIRATPELRGPVSAIYFLGRASTVPRYKEGLPIQEELLGLPVLCVMRTGQCYIAHGDNISLIQEVSSNHGDTLFRFTRELAGAGGSKRYLLNKILRQYHEDVSVE